MDLKLVSILPAKYHSHSIKSGKGFINLFLSDTSPCQVICEGPLCTQLENSFYEKNEHVIIFGTSPNLTTFEKNGKVRPILTFKAVYLPYRISANNPTDPKEPEFVTSHNQPKTTEEFEDPLKNFDPNKQ